MKKINNFNKSFVTVEVESVDGEKVLNYLWNKNVSVKNVRRNNMFSITLEIKVSEYHHLEGAVRKLKGKMRVVDRRGIDFLSLKLRHRKALFLGVVLFFLVLYYMGRFIWSVEIVTDKYLAPLEVRNILKSYGIMVGSRKNSIDVLKVEEDLVIDIDEIMWVKARIEGSKLRVEIVERQEPPIVKEKEYTGDLVAKKNGVINRVYTSAGTAVKGPGTVVNKGDLIVKGQEGKEGLEFSVKAEGKIYATTFYEEIKVVKASEMKSERTGNEVSSYCIDFNNKKTYLKKSLNDFATYDKIETKWWIFTRETYRETKEVEVETDTDIIIKELQNKITLNLDRGIKLLEVKPEVKKLDDKYEVRVLVTVEEDIAQSEVVTPKEVEEVAPNM